MDRRQFLKTGLGTTGGLVLPVALMSQAHANTYDLGFDLTKGERRINLFRPKTGERLNFVYMRDGVWQDEAYEYICWILRDVKAGKHARMDPRLIAVLDWTQRYLTKFGYHGPIHILSGYRTPETNEKIEGAVQDSQHTLGKAVDMRIPGVSPAYLSKLFNWLAQGGVGLYTGDGFTHIDTGRVRKWGK